MTNHSLLKPEVGNRERWAGLTLMLDLARLYTALLVAFNLRWGCGLTTSRRSQWVGRFAPSTDLLASSTTSFASLPVLTSAGASTWLQFPLSVFLLPVSPPSCLVSVTKLSFSSVSGRSSLSCFCPATPMAKLVEPTRVCPSENVFCFDIFSTFPLTV